MLHANPTLIIDAIVAALDDYIRRFSPISGDGSDASTRTQQSLLVVLSSSAAFGENVSAEVKEDLLMKSVILAHHPFVGM